MKVLRLIFIAIIVTSSCKHDHLYYATEPQAIVQINVDWTQSVLNPNGVTAIAYNSVGGEIETRFATQSASKELRLALPEGEYDILLFNNSESEYANIEFAGVENINKYVASAKTKLPVRTPSESDATREVVEEPEIIASSLVKNVLITKEDVDIHYDRPTSLPENVVKVYDVAPQRRVSTFVLQARVKGLNFAAGAPRTFFKHLAKGYYLGVEKIDEREIMHEFILNSRQFEPGSTTVGTITKEFTSFGLLEDDETEYIVDIDFVLIDGKHYPVIAKFTKENIEIRVEDGVEKHFIFLELTLPEAVGGDDGAFDVEVEEWEDILVPLPM